MPCPHRFANKLVPTWQIKYLFIGTFNPAWNGKNNAAYFYGRPQNKFWEIMPQALNLPSQITNQSNPEFLEEFLKKNQIGLTDLIKNLESADEKNSSHRKAILSFKDDELLRFKPIFNEKIFELILRNSQNLQQGGVFLTRKTNPPGEIGLFWQQITKFCDSCKIPHANLISPSMRIGKYSTSQKVNLWKKTIQQSEAKYV